MRLILSLQPIKTINMINVTFKIILFNSEIATYPMTSTLKVQRKAENRATGH